MFCVRPSYYYGHEIDSDPPNPATVVVFSLITLGLAGAITSAVQSNFDLTFTYASLAIATAVITMVTVGVMYAVSLAPCNMFLSLLF